MSRQEPTVRQKNYECAGVSQQIRHGICTSGPEREHRATKGLQDAPVQNDRSLRAATGHPAMRVVKLWPNVDWRRVWKTLSEATVPESKRAAWYRVIYNITPTNERLARIKLAQTDTCRHCKVKDTLEHRLTVCCEGKEIWEYTETLMARMLRTSPTRIPNAWLVHPQFQIWPPKRQRAILWTLANVVLFRTQQQWNLTLQDYTDFLHRSKCKVMCRKKGRDSVGNYLTVMDSGMYNSLH